MAINTAQLEQYINRNYSSDSPGPNSLKTLRFLGATPRVASPNGYAVKLDWNASFLATSMDGKIQLLTLDAHTPCSVRFENAGSDKPSPTQFAEDALNEKLSIEECARFGIDTYNIHTGYRYFDAATGEEVSGSPCLSNAIDLWHKEGRATHIRILR